jgi:hypothetical protein
VNLISTATSAIVHPLRTAATVAGQTVGVAAGGAKMAIRIIDRAAGQVRGHGSTAAAPGGTETSYAPDVTPPRPAAQKSPARKPAARKPAARKPARKAPSAQAATIAPALSVTEEEVTEGELRTPSGIPAADEGHNPDTAETDLYQPGTEPLMDPATVKSAKSEAETMQRAADPDKD